MGHAEDRADIWWRQTVVYQVYVRSFADSGTDGAAERQEQLGSALNLHPVHISRRVVLPVALAVGLAVTLPALAGQPSTTPAPRDLTLPSVTPGFARTAAVLGTIDPTSRVDFSVTVAGRDDAAMAVLARQVSDPTSPLFRRFLTKAQRAAEFDPAPAATQTVVDGLKALGLSIGEISADGRLIKVHASAATVSSALGVRFAQLASPLGGTLRTAMNQPLLPAALRPLVSNVIGLSVTPVHTDRAAVDSAPAVSTPVGGANASFNPATAYFNGRPCSAYYGEKTATDQPSYNGISQPYTICGYSPQQIRAAYRVPESGLDGTGVHIGIVDNYSSPTMVADTDQYSSEYGVPGFASGQYVDHTDPVAANTPETTVDDSDPIVGVGSLPAESPNEWAGEQSLDVEMEHTIAPKATIDYYGGDQGIGLQPLEAEFAMAMADASASFVSDSWGAYEGDLIVTPADFQLMDTNLQVGAVMGIGASFSSGDDADNVESTGTRQADFPASDDLGTAVGGTTVVVGPNNSYIGETYWGTRLEPKTKDGSAWDGTPLAGPDSSGPPTGPGTLAGGGGGGVSAHYAEPSWQTGVVPASLTTSTADGASVTSPGRVLPDVSAIADSTTGVLVGQTQTDKDGTAAYSEYRIGGTSVSSPVFGGLMALAIQKNGGKSLGFISPAMYLASKNSPQAFRDPSLGRNLVNVRTDYSDTQDPTSPTVFHLRLLGQLSSLHDLVGYDDSTGLGTPCAPAFAAAVVTPMTAVSDVPGCGLPLPAETKTVLPPSLAKLVARSAHKSQIRVGGRGPVKVGKAYTYDALLFTVSGYGEFATPSQRTVYIYVNGKRYGKATTVQDKKHPYQANAFTKITFRKPGTYYVSAAFAGAPDLMKSTTRGQKVVVAAVRKSVKK